MKRIVSIVFISVFLFGSQQTSYASPQGATGKCNDGTYSYSASHRGMCARHGGVSFFISSTTSVGTIPKDYLKSEDNFYFKWNTSQSGCKPGDGVCFDYFVMSKVDCTNGYDMTVGMEDRKTLKAFAGLTFKASGNYPAFHAVEFAPRFTDDQWQHLVDDKSYFSQMATKRSKANIVVASISCMA
jgi:hypothetical protein